MTSIRTGIAHQPRGQTTIEYLTLEEVRVRAWVVDVSSRIVLSQTFYNPSDESTGRAKYVFPLPANAAVCAFELELEDGTVIVGEVKEKEDAALNFTRAVEQGKTAALVERVTDDIFTISVGSIPATTRVIAHLTFIMDLLDEALHDHVRLQLPMYIAERYGTPHAAMNNTSAADTRTRVRINVDVQTSDVIHAIRSPTHTISLRRYKGRSNQYSKRRMSAVWKSSGFLNSDFVITIHAEGLDKPRCFAEVMDARREGDEEGSTVAMQLTLVPKFQAPKIPSQEYIFIIDRSGSMSNTPIETAKRTLIMLLRLLPFEQTTFNIFSFGSKVTSLWPSSRGLDRRTLVEATTHVQSMSADYGGTEIVMAVQSAFRSRGLDRPAVVFLLTDGQVNNEPYDVISNAVRGSPPHAPVRLFVLGIGTGVSSDECSKLARQGNGEYLFALSAEDILGKCARLLNAGRSKNIERIDIDWGYDASAARPTSSPPMTLNLPAGIPELVPPPPVQQAPHTLTKIFSGIRFTVFAITLFRTVPTAVRLITTLEGGSEPQELIVDVKRVKPFRDTNEHSIVPIVHTLAARKLIMELDDGVGPLPTPAPADALLVSEDDLRKAGIVRLGLSYQLVSKHTSFVAIQKGDERIRNRVRGGGSMAWARSRLRQSNLDTQESSPAEAPTLLDDFVSGVSSLISSVLGLFSGSSTLTSTTTTFNPPHQSRLPGAFDGSDSGTSESSRGRRDRSAPSPRRGRSTSSHISINSFSTLSSLDGSSCSSCWTSSRPPSPLPRFRDPVERAPSPDFLWATSAPGGVRPTVPSVPNNRVPISQEVYDLFQQMDVDGSITVSPLLRRLVGDAVLDKADDLGIDKKVWATVVVVAYMQIHLQGEPDILDLVSEKAREFVEATGVTRFEQMVREAAALLSA
ncbi:hypothetical protein L210DRAFT_3416402 [Boletus edulis BED1]|uniref:von Willebrand domain-containing protein n=1 Tax=Boletus edulis BED1 TaxID=1328754 RepID=A0AAD4BIV4_BOLED|nr:hypothetical protein L210DRAFT_3416402 [Boletus edulis BED1]